MKRTQHASEYATLTGGFFVLMAAVSTVIAVIPHVQPAFLRWKSPWPSLFAAVTFLVPGVGMLRRKTWAWYAGLLTVSGFTAAGLSQIVAQERIGVATVLVGLVLAYSIIRSSSAFPDAVYPILPERSEHIPHGRIIGGPVGDEA